MNGQAFSLNEPSWSPAEKKIARKAFDQALTRQCGAIAAKAKTMMMAASTPQDLWEIHDYLSEQRRIVDQSYDYRYSVRPAHRIRESTEQRMADARGPSRPSRRQAQEDR